MSPCTNYPNVYDVLADGGRGLHYNRALEAARNICGACLLAETCHAENADERWVKAILGRRVTPDPPPARLDRAQVIALRAQARIAALTKYRDAGTSLTDVLAELDMQRASLWEWCKRHGCPELYEQISGHSAWTRPYRRERRVSA